MADRVSVKLVVTQKTLLVAVLLKLASGGLVFLGLNKFK